MASSTKTYRTTSVTKTRPNSLIGPSFHTMATSGVVMASITAGLKIILWQILQDLVAPEKVALFQEFFNGVYPKWFFNGLRAGVLDSDTFQLQPGKTFNDLIMTSDLDYFGRIRGVAVKALPVGTTAVIQATDIVLNQLHDNQIATIMDFVGWQMVGRDRAEIVAEIHQRMHQLQALYEGLSGTSNFLSVPPVIKQDLVELFASPFNTGIEKYRAYCSAFAIEKTDFGSLGSFFDYNLQSETNYLANPPFDETMMADMVVRLNQQLSRPDLTNVTVIVTIPEWNPPFLARDLLEQCRFVRSSCRLTKQKHCYYDYGLNRYIAVCYSRLYVLSNSDWSDVSMEASKIAQRWEWETGRR